MSSPFAPELTVITGPMFSGKSEELLRRIKRAKIVGIPILVVKPKVDTRTNATIKSRSGYSCRASKVGTSKEILKRVRPKHRIIFIDEAQFFDTDLPQVVIRLLRSGRRVVVSGLDLDFQEKPFVIIGQLLCLATTVLKLTAECKECCERPATRTQRIVESEDYWVIGDETEYAARCLTCFVPSKPPPP